MCTSILFTLQVCLTSVIISHSHSYLLLAANMDDFRTIAKKFVPEKFVDQLANMASAPGRSVHGSRHHGDNKRILDNYKKRNMDRGTGYTQNEDISKISFDQLVQMVKDRIQNDPAKEESERGHDRYEREREPEPEFNQDQNKYNPYHINRDHINRDHKEEPLTAKYENTDYKEYPIKDVEETTTLLQDWQDTEPQFEEPVKADNGDLPFSRVEMINKGNDSYEDYVTPKKEDNIFESAEVVETPQTERDVYRTTQFRYQNPIPDTEALIKKLPKAHANRSPSKYIVRNKKPNPPLKEPHRYTPRHARVQDRPRQKSQQLHHVSNQRDAYAKHRFDITNHKAIERKPKLGEGINFQEEEHQNRPEEKKVEIHEEPPEKYHAKLPLDEIPSRYDDEYVKEYAEEKTEEPKAKTENLWYDDKAYNLTENQETDGQGNGSKNKVTKRLKGTMIPKRDFYKMSSPNYYAKIPIVAEKYDFNEPIPEKDREPEVLDVIDTGPAIINGKVRINSNRPKRV